MITKVDLYPIDIKMARVRAHEDTKLPTKAHEYDACYDLYAAEEVRVFSYRMAKVRTNTKIQLPKGWEARIATRSGMAAKGIQVHNGVIDYGYTGELFVVVYNLGYDPQPTPSKENKMFEITHWDSGYLINKGDRIAQIQCRKIDKYNLIEADFESEDTRGGFGSSGN